MNRDYTLISLVVLLLLSVVVFTTTNVSAEEMKQSSSNLVKESSTQIKESQEQKSSSESTEESSNTLKSTTESDAAVEKCPDAQINFKTEHLMNLMANANYKVNNQMVTADGRGEILIDNSWFGKNIYIIKSGSNISADSETQSLYIPNKPNITIKQNDIIVQNHEISYKNPIEGVKYTIDGVAPQNNNGEIVFKNLDSGKKYLFKAVKEATNNSFKSECTAVATTTSSSNTQDIDFGGLAYWGKNYSFLRVSFSNYSNTLSFTELRDGQVHPNYASSLYFSLIVKGLVPFTKQYQGNSRTNAGYKYSTRVLEGSEIDIYHREISAHRWSSQDPDLSYNDVYNGSKTQVYHVRNGRIVHDWQVMPPTLNSVKDTDNQLSGRIPKQSITYGRSYTLKIFLNGAFIGSESVTPDTSYNYSFPKNIKLHGGDKVSVQLLGTSSSGPYKSNSSVMVIKDVTATPAFVVIPKNLSLHDKVSSATEELKLLDSQNNLYHGGATATIKISSKNNFKFSNGGEYQIIDEKQKVVSSSVLLSRDSPIKKIQAILTKKAKINKISNDSLIFDYSIKN